MGEAGLAKWKMQVERALELDVVRDVVLHEDEVAADQVLDVGDVAGQEVVHPHHGVAAVEQVLGEVRPDEAGGAGDESSAGIGSRAHA